MAGFVAGKMKRKELEDVYDEFSEFSLSSPAFKIRRLDADLPPIMEEEATAGPVMFGEHRPKEHMAAGFSGTQDVGSVMRDAEPSLPSNEERAIVLYRPVDSPLVLSPGHSVSYRVSSDLIHGLKNRTFYTGNPLEDTSVSESNCLAMVPWVPTKASVATNEVGVPESQSGLSQEPMEAEETETASMEVEEEREQATTSGKVEGFHQWQQHCLTPQLPADTSTPIMWSW